MIKKTLKIFGQIIVGIVIISLGSSLVNFIIPGNRDFCDADQIYMFYFGVTFLIVSLGFLINSIIFYKKKQWIRYRICAITLTLLLGLLIISTRSVMTKLLYGKVSHIITNENGEFPYIKVRLYRNKKFISETYDVSCNIETKGTYELADNELILHFKGEKSSYLETKYKIINDTLTCIDCENEIRLILNKN